MKKNLQKIWKNFLASFALFICTASLALMLVVPVNAQSVSDTITNIATPTSLPSYATNGHANASIEFGANNITSAIYYAVDYVKYIIGTIAVITIIISGFKLVTAGTGAEEESKKTKEHLKYAGIGLIVIMIADPFIKQVFFGQQGEIYSSQTTLQQAANAGSAQIKGLYEIMAYFCGALAILEIVLAGFRYVTSGGNEEMMKKAKTQITYAVIGLMLVGIAEFAVKDIIFPNQGSQLPDTEKLKQLIVNLTNFISGFLTTIAAVMYIYGGYIYVTAFGNEEVTGKAKKIFIGATIGLLLAMGAFAIVNTTVKLENQIGPSSTPAATAGSTAPVNSPASGAVGP